MLSVELVRSRLRYDPETGKFYWRERQASKPAGSIAGGEGGNYWRIGIDGRVYPAHRLAWMCVYGSHPDGEIDHINGDKLDNRLANLRVVSRSENMRNIPLRVDNTHGVPGVYYNRAKNRWYAQCCHGGKNRHLGFFSTFDEAAAARKKFQLEHGYHENHGREARRLAARIAEKKTARRALK